ncbi:MAG: penicillin-binding protein activator [Deltaproteobacteria bacterium]|nr:penicillin-binding protein activator [Deltaproteobacteria bacterium]
MMQKIIKASFILLVCFLCLQCGGGSGGGSKTVQYPNHATPQMETEFAAIESQYRRRNYDYAFDGYQNFIHSQPYTKLTDEALYKQGKIFFVQKRYFDALQKFKELAQKTPSANYAAKAWHMAGYAAYLEDNFSEAYNYLSKVSSQQLPIKMRLQSLSLKARSEEHVEADKQEPALLALYNAYEGNADETLKRLRGAHLISYANVLNKLDAWVRQPLNAKSLPNWIKRYPESPAKAYVDFRVASAYQDAGDQKKAQRAFTRFINQYPKNRLAPTAQKNLLALGGPDAEEVMLKKADYKVGVLLPLSGYYESYGYSVLDGVKCAAGVGGVCAGPSGIELVVRDSGNTTNEVRAAVQDLLDQNVVAIVGPLSASLAIEASVLASSKEVPIFPITQKTSLMSQGQYIFQIGMEPKQQIQQLVAAAFNKGHRSFGVFYPNTVYGQTMAELFIQEVEAADGVITAKAEYRKHSTDPFAEARKLKQTIGRMERTSSRVGFDALFIPDSFQTVNKLVPGLEFNGISGVPLLGTNAWNDPELNDSIADRFPGSFFVDLYNGYSDDRDVKEFKQMFVTGFGREPRVLEAYGYDILNMVRMAASKGSRRIQDYFEEGRSLNGVTGIKGFRVGDAAVIEPSVLRIKEDGLQ